MLGIAGTAATIYGGVVLHRQINKPSIEKVAKNFSEIFRKEVSADDAQKMVNRYKEIFEIKDEKTFRDTMFNQLKKDYGLENTDFGLTIEKLEDGIGGGFNHLGAKNGKVGEGLRLDSNNCVQINEKYAKKRKVYFSKLVHELNHAKQFEIAYRTNSKEAMKINLSERLINDTAVFDKVQKYIKEVMGDTKPDSLIKGSKEYELGLKYIADMKHYVSSSQDFDTYLGQFIETESRNAEKMMAEIENSFLSIWRI